MAETVLIPAHFARAADALGAAADRSSDEVDLVAEVVVEALVDQAARRAPAVSPTVVDEAMRARKATPATGATGELRPLEVLRAGPSSEAERAVLAALVAWHVDALLERRDGVRALRDLLPAFDWLEFQGSVPPYTAVRETLEDDARARVEELLRAVPVEAPTARAADAVRALRGIAPPPLAMTAGRSVPPLGGASTGRSVRGELEGAWRNPWVKALLLPWGALRGAFSALLRGVFSLRSPMTLAFDGESLRVNGHTELLGRTLRSYDLRFPVTGIAEIRRESRFPALPAAASVFALTVGSMLGARTVIEAARASYFPLVAIGLGMIAAGILFDWLLRAIFPGVTGRTRLTVRTRDGEAVVLTALPVDELDAFLDGLDPAKGATLLRDATAPDGQGLSGATLRDPQPARRGSSTERPAEPGRG
ncbi:MAG: hypothetical protein R3A48_18205 [Polyangiales bacterium]